MNIEVPLHAYIVDASALSEKSRRVHDDVRAAGVDSPIHELPASAHTAVAAAAALGCDVGAIGSSLLFLVDEEPLLVMTSGRHRVDTEVLAAAMGAEHAKMAPAKLVKELTGQVIGGVAPVGHPARIRTVVDDALRAYPTVWTAAGVANTVMPMTFDNLVALTDGTVISVAND